MILYQCKHCSLLEWRQLQNNTMVSGGNLSLQTFLCLKDSRYTKVSSQKNRYLVRIKIYESSLTAHKLKVFTPLQLVACSLAYRTQARMNHKISEDLKRQNSLETYRQTDWRWYHFTNADLSHTVPVVPYNEDQPTSNFSMISIL